MCIFLLKIPNFVLLVVFPPHVIVDTFQYSTQDTKKRFRGEVERTLRAEELAGDVEGLTSHNDDLLAVEQLLGDSAGQTTKEVSLAVDDDLIHD
jgi:hypothetical protein